MPESSRLGERVFRGIPVSSGVSQGRVLVLLHDQDDVPQRTITDDEVPREIQRFESALVVTRKQVMEVQDRLSKAMGTDEANIFEAHLLVLEDPALVDQVEKTIAQDKVNVEYAFHQVAHEYIANFKRH